MTYIEEIARAIHSEVAPGEALDPKERNLYLVYAALALSLGAQVTTRNVHDAWAAWKAMTDPLHEAIEPFDELGEEQREQDQPYAEAIKKVVHRLGEKHN